MRTTPPFKFDIFGNSRAIPSFALLMLSVSVSHAGVLNPGQSETIDSTDPIESWTLNPGSELISNGADTDNIGAVGAKLEVNGGSNKQIALERLSVMNMIGGTVANTSGTGAAINLASSSAEITNSTITSNAVGLMLTRNIQDQSGSSVKLVDSTVTASSVGAQVNGLGVLELIESTISATGTTSDGVRLLNGSLSAKNSFISGGDVGLHIGSEPSRGETSTVVLDDSRIEGRTGPAISTDLLNLQGAKADIHVLNDSTLVAGNGNVLEVKNGATVGLTVDNSALVGDVVVDSGSAARTRFQNGASLAGNLQNVAQVTLDTRSTMTGDVLAQAGSGAAVTIDNGAALNGNVNNVISLSLNHGGSMTGDVVTDTAGTVALDNGATLTGQIENSANIQIRNAGQWVTTGNSSVQSLELEDGIVRLGDTGSFHQLDVENVSGKGTFVMHADLNTERTDFLNVTKGASGEHKLQVTASGTNPTTPDLVKIGNVAGGDASFALNGNGLVDAGSRTYGLLREGEGLFLKPNQTVSTSTNTVLAIAGSTRSILYGEMTSLNSRLGDRRLSSSSGDTSPLARSDTSMKKLSNSVWMRTYGSQYNVSNAYGGGFTQNQRGFSLGADTQAQLGGQQWLVGAFVGSGRTDIDLKNGSTATVDSLNAGVYGTLLDVASGMYVDVVGKVNQFDNQANVTMSDGTRSKGNYKNLGLSATVEVGKLIRFDNGDFIEPFAQVGLGAVQAKQYRLDNGLEVDAGAAHSLLGKVGMTIGREITLDNASKLQPRVRLAMGHEFVKSNDVKVNNDDFNSDPSSTSLEYTVGVNWVPAQKNWQVYGEAGGSKGNTIEQNWNYSVGVSYNF
ncbi:MULTISPECIES: autotransporter outer membrane beta-barrel domain-containing protein [Pseudomonas]|jgi:outer membrane autotransporter protein|uniref:autotransporter outer membrane beta-barrel domain-containing protein n=1 Tax=Pseudomonas TaxID=286 RepID=UPI0008761F5C|nr:MULTISPECIES: autotransporter outer membrane beta-barrel domain-containing protein [Pseudomonas]MBP4000746.1 autotransporter outer membrane beta-barrel domain-containing protein [Pseudomonas koreensis]POA40790.1 autotransporter outer membrane beta-barrel domain-containing protein [Pseudomonas sp. GW456-12-1-14-TSB6]QIA03666.1 autotransporter outer membrane beta-barrel domain-containing protein [Pseudomonas fluorescens]TFA86477.1 outer membrane autotransporter protein [Pseudomonas sp. LAIL14H